MGETIQFAIPAELRWDGEIIKTYHEALPYYIPNFEHAEFNDRDVTIASRSLPQGNAEELTNALVALATSISRHYRDITETVTRKYDSTAGTVENDPFKELTAAGDIVSTGRGKFVYRGRFVKLFNGLDNVIKDYCVGRGTAEEIYPTTVKASSLRKAGYLSLHPHLAFFVAPVAKNKKAIDVVGTLTFDSDNTDTEQVSTELFDYPAEILSPTVCYHCFEAMSHTTISKHRVTALNKCHRHEPVNVGGLSRLTTYWMRELILFDDPDTLAEELDKSIDFTCALLEELDVGYEVVSANDPFFGTQGAGNRMMQSALQLKREIKVPIWGGRKIAIGSFNLHQETLLKKFDIEKAAQDDETLWSGCIGWGYDRFLLGILSRHGSDIDNWPDTAKCAFSLTRI